MPEQDRNRKQDRAPQASERKSYPCEDLNADFRVFVSSTFRDMECERKLLNQEVFPEFREECRRRGVFFTEVDLQWGITEKQAKEGGAVAICLSEVARCRPHFIVLLGERYGWAPQDDNVKVEDIVKQIGDDEELKRKVKRWYEEGESVTAMEILHGVLEYGDQHEYSFFYFRKRAFTDKLASESGSEEDFYEQNPDKEEKLKRLKERICRTFGGKADQHVREYGSFEELKAQVLEDLRRTLDRKFPDARELSPLEEERRKHCAALLAAAPPKDVYVEDRELVRSVMQDLEAGRPVVITGEEGMGKSALLVQIARKWHEKNPSMPIILRHAGTLGDDDPTKWSHSSGSRDDAPTKGSSDPIRHLWDTIRDDLQEHFPSVFRERRPSEEEDDFSSEGDVSHPGKDDTKFDKWSLSGDWGDPHIRRFVSDLTKVPEPVLIVVDDLDALPSDRVRQLFLSWPESAGNVRAIFAAASQEIVSEAKKCGWAVHELPLFDKAKREAFVKQYLDHYRKDLDGDLKSELIKSAEIPLYLRVVLDELRIGSKHDDLKQDLKHLLQTGDLVCLCDRVFERVESAMEGLHLDEGGKELVRAVMDLMKKDLEQLLQTGDLVCLFDRVLERVESAMESLHRDEGGKELVRAVMGLLCAAQSGLSETELREIAAERVGASPMALSGLLARLGDYLAVVGGRYRFRHAALEKAARRRYASSDQELRDYRLWLAEYFARQPLNDRQLDEYPRQLAALAHDESLPFGERAKYRDELLAYLERLDVFREFYEKRPGGVWELLWYRDAAGFEPEKMAKTYLRQLAQLQATEGLERAVRTAGNVGGFMLQAGFPLQAEFVFRHALKMAEPLGDAHPEVADLYSDLGVVLARIGKYGKAVEAYERALAVCKRGENPWKESAILNNLGLAHLNLGRYDEAERYLKEALEIREKEYARQKSQEWAGELAKTMDNFGELAMKQGRLDEAQAWFQKACDIREKAFGREHPEIAASYSNLAHLAFESGNYDEVEAWLNKALEVEKRFFGPNHPRVLNTLENLAG
ncbi:MAG: tetratricopeptide repeat protein, partial [Zetaproteobacteria bacterium]